MGVYVCVCQAPCVCVCVCVCAIAEGEEEGVGVDSAKTPLYSALCSWVSSEVGMVLSHPIWSTRSLLFCSRTCA